MSKKYRNPVPRPEMVRIPVWEYKQLVEKATVLETAQALADKRDDYIARDMLVALFKGGGKAKEDGE